MADPSLQAADIHDALAMRQASAGVLSLALMDARNRSLVWLTAFENHPTLAPSAEFDPPAWTIGHAAWFQEYWTSRFLQRNRGALAEARAVRLASIDPRVDDWLAPLALTRAQRWQASAEAAASLRDYLAASLEATLELLDKSDGSEASLYFFRTALLHEDRLCETLAELARVAAAASEGVAARPPATDAPTTASALPTPATPPARPRRGALGLPGGTVGLGAPALGFAPDNERPAFDVQVPAFEIDAQAVGWAEFAEFAADGGYDEPRWWASEGWAWLQRQGRRAPRHVEQLAGGVLVQRQGRVERAAGGQAALHITWYEADAWCRWAGRRLPTEAEWTLAVQQAQARGLAWGDGFEWIIGSAHARPGQVDGPARLDALPALPGWRVLRGASLATVPRWRHPGARRIAQPDNDRLFGTFRSCAM